MFSGEHIPIDLNNPKNVWNINRLCENKSEYLEYHQKVAAAFKQDCEKLLQMYDACKDLTFKTFADVWQQSSFSLVFVGQEFVEELTVFAESCYFVIKKYLIFSPNIHIQVGAFYLLYGIYSKQPSKDVVKIRVTHEEYLALLKLVEQVRCKGVLDVIYIFKELKYNEAFQFVATPRCLGLEAKFTWHEKKMRNDIFKNTMENNPVEKLENVLYLDSSYNLNSLDKICRDYDVALQEYAKSTSSKPIGIHSESHVVKHVEDLFNQLERDLQGPPNIIEEKQENKTTAERKKAIKERGYQSAKTYRK